MIFANESTQQWHTPFHSFKKAIKNHPNEDIRNNVELISAFSLKRGLVPDGTKSGGFLEFVNIDDFAMDQIKKLMSMMLSSSSPAQISLDLILTAGRYTGVVSEE